MGHSQTSHGEPPTTSAPGEEGSGSTGVATSGEATAAEATTAGPATTTPVDTSTGVVTTGGETTGAGSTGTGATTGQGGNGLYRPCDREDPPCPSGQLCFLVDDIDGDFCTPECIDGITCPPSDEGTAEPMCVLISDGGLEPTHCVLICEIGMGADQCPIGMSCKPIPNAEPLGLCTSTG